VIAGTASSALEEDNASAWPPTIGSLITATALACLICRLPTPGSLSWLALLLISSGYVAVSTLAGAFAAWSVWSILPTKPALPRHLFLVVVSVGPLWLPCLILFYREDSAWLVPVIALSSAITANCLRADVFSSPCNLPALEADRSSPAMVSFLEVRPPDFRPWFSLIVAICMQAAMLACLAGDRLIAGSLLASSYSMLVWRWARKLAKNRPNNRAIESMALRLILFGCIAIFLTSAALAPYLATGVFAGASPAYPALEKPGRPSKDTVTGARDSSYSGVILWTVPPQRKEITAPPPKGNTIGIGRIVKPLTIPFDGVYWYFKKPDSKPHRDAHVVHGTPNAVDIHSSDWHPILMEAHQKLGSSIPLSCCGELQVAIENADNRPGRITLGLILTDSASPDKAVISLGERVVVSSELGQFSLNRAPVNEILRFAIPTHARISNFDAITVLFLPAGERSLGGAQIAIRQFVLIPVGL
jgi:hypothetical protein